MAHTPPPLVMRRVVPPASASQQGSSGSPVAIDFSFEGVGALYQGYFLGQSAVLALSRDMSACVDQAVAVRVRYLNNQRAGQIVGVLPPNASRCAPKITNNLVDFTPVIPAGKALAQYRDRLANRVDVRIASFEVGVAFGPANNPCYVQAEGTYPPDGSTFSACVVRSGHRYCAPGDAAGVTQLAWGDETTLKPIADCF